MSGPIGRADLSPRSRRHRAAPAGRSDPASHRRWAATCRSRRRAPETSRDVRARRRHARHRCCWSAWLDRVVEPEPACGGCRQPLPGPSRLPTPRAATSSSRRRSCCRHPERAAPSIRARVLHESAEITGAIDRRQVVPLARAAVLAVAGVRRRRSSRGWRARARRPRRRAGRAAGGRADGCRTGPARSRSRRRSFRRPTRAKPRADRAEPRSHRGAAGQPPEPDRPGRRNAGACGSAPMRSTRTSLAGSTAVDLPLARSGYLAIEPADRDAGSSRRLLPVTVIPDRAPTIRVDAPGKDLLLPDATPVVGLSASAHGRLRPAVARAALYEGLGLRRAVRVQGRVASADHHARQRAGLEGPNRSRAVEDRPRAGRRDDLPPRRTRRAAGRRRARLLGDVLHRGRRSRPGRARRVRAATRSRALRAQPADDRPQARAAARARESASTARRSSRRSRTSRPSSAPCARTSSS